MTHRFFIPPTCISKDNIKFPKDIAHQMSRVLRMQAGQGVIVLDNLGVEYNVELSHIDSMTAYGTILSKQKANSEPDVYLTLCLSLTQRDKFEWILQKGTEIGVSEFIPLITDRTLVRSKDGFDKKRLRWQKIIREAAEQSGRGKLPVLQKPTEFQASVLEAAKTHDLCLLPWEEEQNVEIAAVLSEFSLNNKSSRKKICLFVGPEGGFTEEESDFARRENIETVTMGPRILRTETAAIVCSALVLYQMGEMGRKVIATSD